MGIKGETTWYTHKQDSPLDDDRNDRLLEDGEAMMGIERNNAEVGNIQLHLVVIWHYKSVKKHGEMPTNG